MFYKKCIILPRMHSELLLLHSGIRRLLNVTFHLTVFLLETSENCPYKVSLFYLKLVGWMDGEAGHTTSRIKSRNE